MLPRARPSKLLKHNDIKSFGKHRAGGFDLSGRKPEACGKSYANSILYDLREE